MPNLSIEYLFKKKHVTYKSKKWEIFEFVDYVTAISFTNTNHNERGNIISGNNARSYASEINKNANEEDLVFLPDSLDKSLEENENKVDFVKIREKKIARTAQCYLRNDFGDGLTQLVNSDLINFLEKDSSKNKSEFDEDVFEKNTDISTMYNSVKKTIISQDEQIMQTLTALFKNQMVVKSDLDIDLIAKLKENILIYGSTGTGKQKF